MARLPAAILALLVGLYFVQSLASASSDWAARSFGPIRVKPATSGKLVKAESEVHFEGTPLEDYGVESDLGSASNMVRAADNGQFSVGKVKAAGVFRVRITDKAGASGKAWWSFVTQPDPLKKEFSIQWSSVTESPEVGEAVAKNAANAWGKLWKSVRGDSSLRASAFNKAADKYLTQNFLSAQGAVLSCAVAFHPLAQAGCAASVASELVGLQV